MSKKVLCPRRSWRRRAYRRRRACGAWHSPPHTGMSSLPWNENSIFFFNSVVTISLKFMPEKCGFLSSFFSEDTNADRLLKIVNQAQHIMLSYDLHFRCGFYLFRTLSSFSSSIWMVSLDSVESLRLLFECAFLRIFGRVDSYPCPYRPCIQKGYMKRMGGDAHVWKRRHWQAPTAPPSCHQLSLAQVATYTPVL